MSLQTYSREYLQNIPQQRKEAAVDRIVQEFKGNLFNAAALGKTSYMYTRSNTHRAAQCNPPEPILTDAELVAGFFARFPGCNIYYEESWVDTTSNTKTLKKGIVIDWS
jgi:hypothetical protein